MSFYSRKTYQPSQPRHTQSQDVFATQNHLASQAESHSQCSSTNDEMNLTIQPTQADNFNLDRSLDQSQFFRTQCSSQNSQSLKRRHSDEEIRMLEQIPQYISESFSQSQFSCPSQNYSQPSQDPTVIEVDDDDSPIPLSILELRRTLKMEKHSDWTFVSTLAMQLCTDSFPIGAYSNLKLALLLSIASINGGSIPIPIVAIGRESSHANVIMNSVGRFADRFVTSLSSFDGSSVSASGTIEAGPLLMAKDGVFFVGDWSGLQPKTVAKLLRQIETGQVVTERVQQADPLQCAIWTYWTSSAKIRKDASVINQLMNVFAVPIMIDDSSNDANIIDNLLNPPSQSQVFSIPEEDFRAYLKHVSSESVSMDEEAGEMLRGYFAAIRKIRPNALTTKAFEVLKQMAESHAKLCLRYEVLEQDVLAAINICEKYIRTFFEPDSYASPAEPQFSSLDDVDDYQNQLRKWFSFFTDKILRGHV